MSDFEDANPYDEVTVEQNTEGEVENDSDEEEVPFSLGEEHDPD